MSTAKRTRFRSSLWCNYFTLVHRISPTVPQSQIVRGAGLSTDTLAVDLQDALLRRECPRKIGAG